MKNKLQSLLGALPLVFALNANSADTTEQKPALPINSQHPIASLCQGDQQFTISRDYAHQSSLITTALLRDMEGCAQAGYKNIIMELVPTKTFEEIQEQYSDLKDKTPEQALAYMKEAIQEMENMVFTHYIASKVDHLDANSAEWGQAYEAAYNDFYNANAEARQIMADAWIAFDNIERNVLLDKWYAHDPSVKEDDIYNAPYWRLENVTDAADQDKKNEDIANIVIKSRELGMRVHFYGDDPGREFYQQWKQDDIVYFEAMSKREAYVSQNQELHDQYMALITDVDPDSEESLESVISKAYTGEHAEKLLVFAEEIGALFQEEIRLGEKSQESHGKYIQQRFSDEALKNRADTFVSFSGGEKTIVLWGGGHFNNESNAKDIDDYLNENLGAQASRQISLYPSRALFQSYVEMGLPQDIDMPDIRYFIEESEVEILNKDNEFVMQEQNAPKAKNSNNLEI